MGSFHTRLRVALVVLATAIVAPVCFLVMTRETSCSNGGHYEYGFPLTYTSHGELFGRVEIETAPILDHFIEDKLIFGLDFAVGVLLCAVVGTRVWKSSAPPNRLHLWRG